MIGYVIPDKGELKVREYEIYTGYYCGICKYIGRAYGQLPRMALSYDAAFIALLLACADPTPDAPTQEHCIVHHIRRKTVIRNRAIEYAGDLMLILAWYKILDDVSDEGDFRAKAGLAAFRPIWKKLQKKHPHLCKSIGEHLTALNQLEKDHCPSIDRVSEDFAQIMDMIFRDGARRLYGEASGGDGARHPGEVLGRIGYHLGKWIYLIDAVDDIEENLDTGSYNPLLYRFDYQGRAGGQGRSGGQGEQGQAAGHGGLGGHGEQGRAGGQGRQGGQCAHGNQSGRRSAGQDRQNEQPDQFRARIDEALRFNLFTYLAVIGESLEALDIQKNSGIIENVIYFGLNRRTEEVLKRITPEKRSHGRL